MFFVIKVGAELGCRYLTWGGDFSSWVNARTFFSKEKAEEVANKIGLAVRVI